MSILFVMIFAYLLGSVSSAVIVCKIFRQPDPRTAGSKNPGATNVLRFGGKKLAFLTLLGDLLKGVIAVLAARLFLPPVFWGWAGVCAVLGHIYPIFFKFKGGKGVATAAGVLLGLYWPLGLLAVLVWNVIAACFRYSSLAAIMAAVSAPVAGYWLLPHYTLLSLGLMCVLIVFRHKANIKRFIRGTEPKIGKL